MAKKVLSPKLFKRCYFFIDEESVIKKSLQEAIVSNGANCLKRFTRSVTHLITATDDKSDSEKSLIEKAELNNIKIITPSRFVQILINKSQTDQTPNVLNDQTTSITLKNDTNFVNLELDETDFSVTVSTLDNSGKEEETKTIKNESAKDAKIRFRGEIIDFLAADYQIDPKGRKRVLSEPIDQNEQKRTKINISNDAETVISKQPNKFLPLKKYREIIRSELTFNKSAELNSIIQNLRQKNEKTIKRNFEDRIVFDQFHNPFQIVLDHRLVLVNKLEVNSAAKFQICSSEIEIATPKSALKKHNELVQSEKWVEGEIMKAAPNQWWRESLLSRKVLGESGIIISDRKPLMSFSDIESLENPLFIDQIETAIINTGLLFPLSIMFEEENSQPLTNNHLSQKHLLVRLMFELGHLIGVMLGEFVQFYWERNGKQKKINLVTFEKSDFTGFEPASTGFLFERNSSDIIDSFDDCVFDWVLIQRVVSYCSGFNSK